MQSGRLDGVTPRHGDWGPAYIIQGPSSDIGLLTLRPGDEMANHVHRHCDESFVVLAGAATLWVNCETPLRLTPGDVVRCEPLEHHYFVNDGAETLQLVFIKSPASPGDTVTLPWAPGAPVPVIPADTQER
ncbi:MAG: cupin domain-containing protein [Propionibacteriaceae bacterium]|jgi:mannose-6-phosphate isomerase-like protein (cupin superfamily)|nr:cupin domain-containing protein [Propionibacteriaceae bacterium]